MKQKITINSLSLEDPRFRIIVQWLNNQELFKMYNYGSQTPTTGLYRVLAGGYKGEFVRVTAFSFYFDFDYKKAWHSLSWYTLQATIDSIETEQEFVPWSLQLITPGNCTK